MPEDPRVKAAYPYQENALALPVTDSTRHLVGTVKALAWLKLRGAATLSQL